MIGAMRRSSSCSSAYQLARPSHHGVEAKTPSRPSTGELLEARPVEAGRPGEEAAADAFDQRGQEFRRNALEAQQAEARSAALPPRGQPLAPLVQQRRRCLAIVEARDGSIDVRCLGPRDRPRRRHATVLIAVRLIDAIDRDAVQDDVDQHFEAERAGRSRAKSAISARVLS